MAPDPMPSDAPEANQTPDTETPASPATRRRRPRFWVILAIVIVVVVLVIIGIVIVVSALTAKRELDAAVPLTSKLANAIGHGDEAQAARLGREFQAHTAAARGAVENPFYGLGASLPGIGSNLVALRTVAQAADDLAADGVVPASALPVQSLKPVDGTIDLSALDKAIPVVHKAAAAVDTAADRVAKIDTKGLLPQVSSAITRLDTRLTAIKPVADGLDSAVDLLPAAFGADGPRSYLLVFQNNAELRALGGNPAALLELKVDKGTFTVEKQASSTDFRHQADIPVASDITAVYGDQIGSIIQNTTMVPDFPTVAGYAQKFWEDRYGEKVDGVLSVDPVALSNLLKATGPVQVGAHTTMTSGNAVKLLLSVVYDRYRVPADQDAFFARSAAAMFDTVVSGTGSLGGFATQLGVSVDAGRLLLWSDHADEQALIAQGPLAGTLPSDNTSATTVGAWINDNTFAKMDYYLDAKITATPSCSASPYSISETLTSSAPTSGLPPYVTGPIYPDGTIHTDVVFTGPVGSTPGDITVGGTKVTPTGSGMIDGRPVVRATITIAPGASQTVAATFTPVDGASSTLVVRHTPMVRDTPVTISPCS